MQEQSRINLFLDWLRVSVPVETEHADLLPDHPCFAPTGEILNPLKNYNSCIALFCGRVDWHTEQPRQRKLFTMSGDDLLRMRRSELHERTLCLWLDAFEDALNVPRLDIAFDTHDETVSPHRAYVAWHDQLLVTSARKITRVQSTGDNGDTAGYTVYIGSRSSEQFLRIYDKLAEQTAKRAPIPEDTLYWTRVELELKDRRARSALHQIAQHGLDRTGGALIAGFVDWPESPVWQLIRQNQAELDSRLGRKQTDFETWFKNVVMPNFEKGLRSEIPDAMEMLKRLAKQHLTDDH